MKIKEVYNSIYQLPSYSTSLPTGIDLRTSIGEKIVIKPGQKVFVNTGLQVEIPVGYEAQIKPGSGLAINHGITVLNSRGTIDADYRGEICEILINLTPQEFVINDGERIYQMVIAKYEKAEGICVDTLLETDRGSGGFGYTGK